MIELILQAERAMSVGQLAQAERLYRQAAELDPRNSIAVVGLARVTLDRGDERGAYVLARRALEIDPENAAGQRLAQRLEEVMRFRGEEPPAVESAPPAVESAPPPVESAPPAVESTPQPVESAPPVARPLPEATPAPEAPVSPAPKPGPPPAPARQPGQPRAAPRPKRRSLLDRIRRRR